MPDRDPIDLTPPHHAGAPELSQPNSHGWTREDLLRLIARLVACAPGGGAAKRRNAVGDTEMIGHHRHLIKMLTFAERVEWIREHGDRIGPFEYCKLCGCVPDTLLGIGADPACAVTQEVAEVDIDEARADTRPAAIDKTR